MKKVVSVVKNKWLIILEICILISCILVPTFLLIPPGKPKIIASLISFDLNGESKSELQSQLLIENLTTMKVEENKEILEIIENDIAYLSGQIEGLDGINIYNYTFYPLPGRVNVQLENVHFKDKKYLKTINSIIASDKSRWWYVDEFLFTPILKENESRDEAYRYLTCGEYDSNANAFFYEHPQSSYDNITILRNETIIASWWINQDGNWSFNEEFYQVLLVEIISLKNRILGIEDLSFGSIQDNETMFNLNFPTVYNLSEPIPYSFIDILGSFWLQIEFTTISDSTVGNAIRKTLEILLLSKWYIDELQWEQCGHISRRGFIGVISIPICTGVFLITTIVFLLTLDKNSKKGKVIDT